MNSRSNQPVQVGEVINYLTVTGPNVPRLGWPVRCVCGTERHVVNQKLIHGRVKSCGCLAMQQRVESKRLSRFPGPDSATSA